MSIGKWNFYFAQLLALDFCCRHKNFNGGTSVCHLHWGLECSGIQHVMRAVWMGAPNQAASLQGYLGVSSATLAANDSGIGSGWQQSKQNRVLAAVMGQVLRTVSTDLCCVEAVSLTPFSFHCWSCSLPSSLCGFALLLLCLLVFALLLHLCAALSFFCQWEFLLCSIWGS